MYAIESNARADSLNDWTFASRRLALRRSRNREQNVEHRTAEIRELDCAFGRGPLPGRQAGGPIRQPIRRNGLDRRRQIRRVLRWSSG